MIVVGTAPATLADGAASVRKPCPVHLVITQADTIIAFSQSLREHARQAGTESNRLIEDMKHLRDADRFVARNSS